MCSHSYCRGVHNLRVCCSCFPPFKREEGKGCNAEGCSKSVLANRFERKRSRRFKYIHHFCVWDGPVAVQNQDDKRGSSHEVVLQLSVIISHPLPSQILRCTNEASIEKAFKTPTVRWLQRHGHHCGKSKSPLSTR